MTWKQVLLILLLGGLGYLFYLGMFQMSPLRFGRLSRLNQEIWAGYDHAQHLRERGFRKMRKNIERKTPDEVREILNR